MENVGDFLRRISDKCGFVREKYSEKDIVTNFSSLQVFSFFGDMRSSFILSTMLLRKLVKPDKYLILCGFPGMADVFPQAKEFWTIKDEMILTEVFDKSSNFYNNSIKIGNIEKLLGKYFDNVIDKQDVSVYYDNGFTNKFLEDKEEIIYSLPSIPSLKPGISEKFNRPGLKAFVQPTRTYKTWAYGKDSSGNIPEEFWIKLVEKLIEKEITPVVLKDYRTHDISRYFASKCIYCTDRRILDILAAMRSCDLVLNIFQDISRYALLARTGFVSCVERHRYRNLREHEIDDLCALEIPKKYVFSFPSLIEGGQWKSLIDLILKKIEDYFEEFDRSKLPDTSAIDMSLSYAGVREIKTKRMGTRFIKVPKI